MKLAIVGAGWAGMAAAVEAAGLGHDVTVFEATRTLGGRARALQVERPDGGSLTLDNGQHILIGAYTETLSLMGRVGVDPHKHLLRLPLGLPFADGSGLLTPDWAARWPAPLDLVAAIVFAKGWRWHEGLALIRASLGWQRAGFRCAATATVADLCARLPARVRDELIEPLCVSALNTPGHQASGQVFLRVLRDALFGRGHAGLGASNLLLPRTDLSSLMPVAARQWLQDHHPDPSRVRIGARVSTVKPEGDGWHLSGLDQGTPFAAVFDGVIWATAASVAADAIGDAAEQVQPAPQTPEHASMAARMRAWAATCDALHFTAITTVYAWAPDARLARPMLALRPVPDTTTSPAQFVFDRGQLGPDDPAMQGVLAFVVSASEGDRDSLQASVMRQAQKQLGLQGLRPLTTTVDRRATFACTPGLIRPPQSVAPGLVAAGDYVEGPYPATLEGAVRSGRAAVHTLIENRLKFAGTNAP